MLPWINDYLVVVFIGKNISSKLKDDRPCIFLWSMKNLKYLYLEMKNTKEFI
jgi:hypothetical protein